MLRGFQMENRWESLKLTPTWIFRARARGALPEDPCRDLFVGTFDDFAMAALRPAIVVVNAACLTQKRTLHQQLSSG